MRDIRLLFPRQLHGGGGDLALPRAANVRDDLLQGLERNREGGQVVGEFVDDVVHDTAQADDELRMLVDGDFWVARHLADAVEQLPHWMLPPGEERAVQYRRLDGDDL